MTQIAHVTQTAGANALAPLNIQEAKAFLNGIGYSETTGMPEADVIQLATIMRQELAMSQQGVDLKPVRFKINKDARVFVDPFGKSYDELVLVIVYKQITRALWEKGNSTAPLCSSKDGITGTERDTGTTKACANCPYNAWGSGVTESGEKTKGKACKESRRIFGADNPYTVPKLLSLPPTSLKPFDEYISARVAQGIADTAAKAIFRLVPGKSEGGFNYAVIDCRLGAKLPLQEMMLYTQMRSKIAAVAAQMEITDEDYGLDEVSMGGGQAAAGADESEPF